MANTNLLKDIRCPECFQADRFAVQMTMNVLVVDDGLDSMVTQPELDHFPGRVIDEEDGFADSDPISCAARYGCGHMGTVGEFKQAARLAHLRVTLGVDLPDEAALTPALQGARAA